MAFPAHRRPATASSHYPFRGHVAAQQIAMQLHRADLDLGNQKVATPDPLL
jgi:hypothetical protein